MTLLEIPESEYTIVAPPLGLSFRWDGLCWSHILFSGETTLAASIESDALRDDHDRIVSPTYQQLSVNSADDGARILLMGQRGRNHSSGVFTTRENLNAVAVEVDVAIRSRSNLSSLASTYRVEFTSSDILDADAEVIVWRMRTPPGGTLRFEAIAEEPGATLVALSEAGRKAMNVQAVARFPATGATNRLRYRWRWSGQAASRGAILRPLHSLDPPPETRENQ
jgi:hypothetical protein